MCSTVAEWEDDVSLKNNYLGVSKASEISLSE